MKDSNITVLIADDQVLLTDGLEMLLSTSGFNVIGKVYNAVDTIREYQRLRPDVLLCDVMFEHSSGAPTGLDILSELLTENPDARVILYSQFDDKDDMQKAYAMGAKSYLTKNYVDSDLFNAIRNASTGKVYFSDSVAHKIAALSAKPTTDKSSPKELLQGRSYDIFIHVALGRTQDEIAEKMGISSRTVQSEIKKIKEVLETTNTTVLTGLAIKHELLDADNLIKQ